MAKTRLTFDTVREIGRMLSDVEEGTMYGTPALKVHGKWFSCIPTHPSAEPDSLAIRVDFAQRDELIAAQPEIYYVKDHYLNYPVVLVRLSKVHRDALVDLLRGAWQLAAAAGKRRRTSRSPVRKRGSRSGKVAR
jgi:hypothetical protein